jgi:Peptidase_C39 like family
MIISPLPGRKDLTTRSSFIQGLRFVGRFIGYLVIGCMGIAWTSGQAKAFEDGYELPSQWGISKFLFLDGDQPQDDGNSCGPNSAARVLRYYGYHVSYDDLKRRFHKTDPILNGIGLGLPGANLAALMKQQGYQATADQATVERVLNLVAVGKPVVAMVRVGTINLGKLGLVGQLVGNVGALINQASTLPALHWIAVEGFDRDQGLVYYTDTNGEHNQLSLEDFERAFNWECPGDMTKTMLDLAGVTPGSIVY